MLLTSTKIDIMKKLSVTLFIMVCLTIMSPAQRSRLNDDSKFSVGIFGGLNIPRLSGGNDNPLSSDYTSRSGVAFGLTSAWNFNSNIGLRVDLMYSSEGGKRNGVQAFDASTYNSMIPAGTYFYADYKNESILNYLEIPVMAKYSIQFNRSLKLFVNFGPYVGILLNAKQKTSGSSIVYADAAGTQPVSVDPQTLQPFPVPFDANTDVSSSIKPVNIGLTGGIGFAQQFNSAEVFMDLRGAYGMNAIQKYSQDGNSHSGNLLIDLGYALHF
jgi:Outer membrane protein beta-barrel domain